MAILGSTDLGDGLRFLSVDHDPAVTATDAPQGSLIYSTSTSKLYEKLDAGSTTNVATKDNPTDPRPPSGAAGGDLGGSYPSPTVNDGADGTAIHDDTPNEFDPLTEKVSPASADLLIVEDSAGGGAKVKVRVGNLPTGGGGENNTASNVGVGGVGVFDQKVGIDLQFRNINAGSPKLTVALDAGNKEVDIDAADASEAQAGVAEIATQAEVDAGTDDTRIVTPLKLANTTLVTPGDQPAAKARRTTVLAIPLNTFTDVAFDTTDFENDAGVLNHDLVTNNDRIVIGETGPYLIGYEANFDPAPSAETQDVEMRIRVNDTTEITGTLKRTTINNVSVNIQDELGGAVIVNLTAGDFISVQLRRVSKVGSGSFNMQAGAVFYAVRLSGQKGDTGTPGAGSTVIVKDDNVAIPNTPHSEIDFGAGLVATDAGSGRALIESAFGAQYQVGESLPVQTETSSTYQLKFRYTTTSLPAGTYFVQMSCEAQTSSSARLGNLRFQENDVDVQEWTEISKQDGFSTKLFHGSRVLGAGTHNYDFEIRDDGVGPGATISVRNMRIVLWRVA